MSAGYTFGYQPYVAMAERRAESARVTKRLERNGRKAEPVRIKGRTIARSFWGRAWCNNLLVYSDFANRLPRGQRYVRNGSVIDLRVGRCLIEALVSGSMVYEVRIQIDRLPRSQWRALVRRCAGSIGSVVELLRGRMSKSVMELIARQDEGLFPAPEAISMTCSCPDVAVMCKHVAAVLYGVGARLDAQPELLFHLRKVDHAELIAAAPSAIGSSRRRPGRAGRLANSRVAGVFGVELEEERESRAATKRKAPKAAGKKGKR